KYDLAEFLEDLLNHNLIENVNLNRINVHLDIAQRPINTLFGYDDFASIFDNIISNAGKARAENLYIAVNIVDSNLIIEVQDDGVGLSSNIIDPNIIFERNYSTTGGTGYGLNHIKNLLEENELGTIEYLPSDKGFKLRMVIKNVDGF